MTYIQLSIVLMEMRVSSTSPRRNLRKACYGYNQRLPYTAKRSANGMRMSFVLSIKLFQNKQFHLVHIHTFHFSFCSHSGMQNDGLRTLLYLQELTNLIRNLILFDIAENMSQRNLNEFVWLILMFNICLNIPRDKIDNVTSYDHT